MVRKSCTFPLNCHIKRVYIENTRDGAKYKGEFCGGCHWWKDPDLTPQAQVQEPQPTPSGWGGKRIGAGAPVNNLNRFKHGGQSKLLKLGIKQMAADPTLRAVLYILVRLADTGEVPPETKKLIQKLTSPSKGEKAVW